MSAAAESALDGAGEPAEVLQASGAAAGCNVGLRAVSAAGLAVSALCWAPHAAADGAEAALGRRNRRAT